MMYKHICPINGIKMLISESLPTSILYENDNTFVLYYICYFLKDPNEQGIPYFSPYYLFSI